MSHGNQGVTRRIILTAQQLQTQQNYKQENQRKANQLVYDELKHEDNQQLYMDGNESYLLGYN
ncbi:hypothetical protein [Colwellia piezophila]|uniref:hypothetical protein n=1 Tax=Colwellia piezophila TaxID=211668 RepID=UPI0003773891|nr:hypothetical protein [Colwellia piezophila]